MNHSPARKMTEIIFQIQERINDKFQTLYEYPARNLAETVLEDLQKNNSRIFRIKEQRKFEPRLYTEIEREKNRERQRIFRQKQAKLRDDKVISGLSEREIKLMYQLTRFGRVNFDKFRNFCHEGVRPVNIFEFDRMQVVLKNMPADDMLDADNNMAEFIKDFEDKQTKENLNSEYQKFTGKSKIDSNEEIKQILRESYREEKD